MFSCSLSDKQISDIVTGLSFHEVQLTLFRIENVTSPSFAEQIKQHVEAISTRDGNVTFLCNQHCGFIKNKVVMEIPMLM